MKFSKRAKFITLNIVVAIFILALLLVNMVYSSATIWEHILYYFIIQAVFSLLSYIGYNLSIIADSIGKKNTTENVVYSLSRDTKKNKNNGDGNGKN